MLEGNPHIGPYHILPPPFRYQTLISHLTPSPLINLPSPPLPAPPLPRPTSNIDITYPILPLPIFHSPHPPPHSP